MKRLSCTIILLALALANQASADTLTFGSLDAQQIPLTTYTEGNFTVQAVEGTGWDIVLEGNPPDALSTNANGVASPGDEVDIYMNDGGLFTFSQFDSSAGGAFLGFPPVTSDEVNFLGSVNTVGTQRLLGFTNDVGPTFTTTSTGFTAPINLLRIVVVSPGSDYLLLDNLVVTPVSPVPEPSFAFVVALVLLGGWGFRRTRYWHSAGK